MSFLSWRTILPATVISLFESDGMSREEGTCSREQLEARSSQARDDRAAFVTQLPSGWLKQRKRRTYVSTTEPLDHMYAPAFRVDSRFKRYFEPTMVTNELGELHEDLIHSGLQDPTAKEGRGEQA